LFIQAISIALIMNLIKNIFEEFAWRGYLTPKIHSLGLNSVRGHLIVGLIWGIWHLPYYLGLIDSAQFDAYTSQSLATFLPLVILGMTAAGIIFGEIRLITGSIWPAVLMHTVSNLVTTTAIIAGLYQIKRVTEFLFTPGMEGLLSIVLITFAGWWLYKQRTQDQLTA
jgi:membrane protease YdiL (CAAX protease family)